MSNSTLTINDGNCQFNATSAKAFRTTLAKWHNADFDIANAVLEKSDRVSALRKLIDTNKGLIEKLNNGQYVIGAKTVSDYESENADFQSKIDAENDAIAEYRSAQVSRLEGGEKLVTSELHKAYLKGGADYELAVAHFLNDNGVAPCQETIDRLIAAVGKKSASARQKCKTGKHNAMFGCAQWRKIFLGELCDIMCAQLGEEWIYKFTYVLKENRNK